MKTQLIVICLLFLVACSKDSGSKDKQPPVTTLISPLVDQQFDAGATVAISGITSDNATISEMHIHISNLQTGALLYDIHRYPAASTYSFNETFVAQAGISYKIQVIAKDNSANEGRLSVEISTN